MFGLTPPFITPPSVRFQYAHTDAHSLTRTEGTVTKGAASFAQVRASLANAMDLHPPFITSEFGRFRANPANFAQIRPIVFLSAFLGLTPPFITPPFVRFQASGERGGAGGHETVRAGRGVRMPPFGGPARHSWRV